MSSRHLRKAAAGMFLRLSILQTAGCVICKLSQEGINPVTSDEETPKCLSKTTKGKGLNMTYYVRMKRMISEYL